VTPEEFRANGYALIDWICAYRERIESFSVSPSVAPGDVRSRLPERAPEHPEPFGDVMADLERVIVPGLTHWQHPSFFAFFPGNATYPSVLADLVSTGLGVNGMLWASSPACTEVEQCVLDWMVTLLGLPDDFRSDGPGGGVIQDSASSATLCAILAARARATGGRSNTAGAKGDLVAYATSEAHSSIEKGIRIAGIGSDNLRLVPIDPTTRAMDVDAFATMVAADRAAGRVPFLAVATAGTTSSTAIDPVGAMAEVCHAEGLWLHVDAAMAGVAAICPELAWVNDGVERAHSYCTNPHKWLGVAFDCDLFYVADRTWLLAALSILPEYLRSAATAAGAVDLRDWQVPLGRRFRSLKLWFTLRDAGAESLRAMVRTHVELAQELASWVASDQRFEIATPHPLSLVCLRLAGDDAATDALIANANATGRVLFTRTVVDGRPVLRFSIGSHTTQRRHVEEAWALLSRVADDVLATAST
jgi:aromatic-L-amino-acid decarboxylase